MVAEFRSKNHILAALPAGEYGVLAPGLEDFGLVHGDVLYEVGGPMPYVYFPEFGVISIVTFMMDGRGVEAVTIGREGFVGLAAAFGTRVATQRSVVQVADGSVRCSTAFLRQHLPDLPFMQQVLGRYSASLFEQAAQSAACNALHPVVERCARWLLQTYDRMEGRPFFLTHEFLGQMLGVRRASVSLAALTLSQAGLVRYRRGWVDVLDRIGLEEASCECYLAVREIQARAVQRLAFD